MRSYIVTLLGLASLSCVLSVFRQWQKYGLTRSQRCFAGRVASPWRQRRLPSADVSQVLGRDHLLYSHNHGGPVWVEPLMPSLWSRNPVVVLTAARPFSQVSHLLLPQGVTACLPLDYQGYHHRGPLQVRSALPLLFQWWYRDKLTRQNSTNCCPKTPTVTKTKACPSCTTACVIPTDTITVTTGCPITYTPKPTPVPSWMAGQALRGTS